MATSFRAVPIAVFASKKFVVIKHIFAPVMWVLKINSKWKLMEIQLDWLWCNMPLHAALLQFLNLPACIGEGVALNPVFRIAIMQSSACSVVAPTAWNVLSLALCLLPRTRSETFYNQLKTVYKSLNEWFIPGVPWMSIYPFKSWPCFQCCVTVLCLPALYQRLTSNDSWLVDCFTSYYYLFSGIPFST